MSVLLAAMLLAGIMLYSKKASRTASEAVLVLLAVGFAVLGCLKQTPLTRYFLSPLILAAIFFSGIAARDGIRSKRSASFILSHLGLAILLASSFFASPDCISTAMILERDVPSHQTADGLPLPFEIRLKEVHTEFYETAAAPENTAPQKTAPTPITDAAPENTVAPNTDIHNGTPAPTSDATQKNTAPQETAPAPTNTPAPTSTATPENTVPQATSGIPKQYRGTLEIGSELKQVSVNHPVLHRGWLLYLSDFDRDSGNSAMLRVVRDPSIPGVLLGMVLLLASAVMGLKRSWKSPLVFPAVLLLALVFTAVSVSRIRFSTLPPALRSVWFAPHLIVYMIAYSMLALSLLGSLLSLNPKLRKFGQWSAPLLETSSSLILTGIIFGSIWAQLSWGDYWAWDAKECWAAATWLLTLGAIHLPPRSGRKAFLAALILSFGAMQMTWYGVNYLPSAQSSMHTYNSK